MKGREVHCRELCKAERCSCRCKYCGRLGPSQSAECDRQRKIEEEWRDPRCRKFPYKGKREPVRFPKPLVLTELLPGVS